MHSHAHDVMVFVDRAASRAAEELNGVVAELKREKEAWMKREEELAGQRERESARLREREEEDSKAREAESRRRRQAEDELRKVLDSAGDKEIYYREIESRAKLAVEEAAEREKMARVEADALQAALDDKDGAVG